MWFSGRMQYLFQRVTCLDPYHWTVFLVLEAYYKSSLFGYHTMLLWLDLLPYLRRNCLWLILRLWDTLCPWHLFLTECTLPLTKVYNSTNPQWFSQINLGLLIPKRESRVLQFDLLYSSHSLGFTCACDISGISECLGNIHNNNNIKYLLSTYYFRDMLNIHMLSHLSSSW